MSAEYRVGDVVQTRRTLKVNYIGSNGFIELKDVQNGDRFWHNPTQDTGTLKVEMVKRAAHRGPKPKAGSTLRGRDIKNIWWKRGTIFRLAFTERGTKAGDGVSDLVLAADGRLYALDDPAIAFEFDDLRDDARFELKYVA